MLNQRHTLYKLASQIDWNATEERFPQSLLVNAYVTIYPKNIRLVIHYCFNSRATSAFNDPI